jgi:hypothetical protein
MCVGLSEKRQFIESIATPSGLSCSFLGLRRQFDGIATSYDGDEASPSAPLAELDDEC